jgi:pentatricopeptide repeat protein
MMKEYEAMRVRHADLATNDISFYNTLILGLCVGKQLAGAMTIFNELRRTGPAPDVFSYGTLLKAHGDMRDLDGVRALMQMMVADGVQPSSHIYAILIDVLAAIGHLPEARAVLDQMRAVILRPTLAPQLPGSSFTPTAGAVAAAAVTPPSLGTASSASAAVVELAAAATAATSGSTPGGLNTAVSLLGDDEQRADKRKLHGLVIGYNTLMKAAASGGDVTTARSLLAEMQVCPACVSCLLCLCLCGRACCCG